MRREFFITMTPLWLISIALGLTGWISPGWAILFTALFALGIYDVLQRRHTVLRNFPVLGHIRYMFEALRPEMQQYFIESDTSPDPIARIQRAVVYQRSKDDLQTVAFGSQLDFYHRDYQWMNHSSFPVHIESANFRIKIGGPRCKQPYEASLFNISAMSYGSISKAAVQALGLHPVRSSAARDGEPLGGRGTPAQAR